jgi:predicted GTPase
MLLKVVQDVTTFIHCSYPPRCVVQVERLLDRVDAAIYLLDYTKLKTAEEAQVLERLKAINPGLVGRLSSRLFFAVNKIDQADQCSGLGEDETREYVAELVTRQLNCPDFRLHPDQVGA